MTDQLELDFDELDAVLLEMSGGQDVNMSGKTVTEILGLSDQRIAPQSLSVKHFDVDVDMYEDLYVTSSVMQDSVAAGQKNLATFDLLHQDMFLSLFKYKPEILSEAQMKKSSILNNRLLKKLVASEDYKALRKHCRLDIYNSALGAEVLGEQANKIIAEWKEDLMEKLAQEGDPSNPFQNLDDLKDVEESLDDLLEQQQELQDLLERMNQQGGSPADAAAVQQELNELELTIQQAEQLANMVGEQLDDFVEGSDDVLNDLATRLMGAFSEADTVVSESSEYLSAWGLDEGEHCRVPFAEKKEAVERIRKTPKLKRLTDLIGRFKDSAVHAQKRKTKDGATSIKSVTIGNKIQDILPSEKLKLVNETTKKDFYRKFNQRELLQYQKESTKPKAKGPIICCIDTSGSMDSGREKWSKAVAIGMLEIASLQKREFAAIHYSNTADEPIVLEKNEVNPTKVLEIAERFHDGGTNFRAPLEKALKLISDSKFNKADIVFITDGEGALDSEFKRKFERLKEEKEFNCMGILVNTGSYGRSSDQSLREFCDSVQTVSEIADLKNADSEVAKAIFSGV